MRNFPTAASYGFVFWNGATTETAYRKAHKELIFPPIWVDASFVILSKTYGARVYKTLDSLRMDIHLFVAENGRNDKPTRVCRHNSILHVGN